MRRRRSTRRALGAQILDRPRETDRAAAPALDAIEHLAKRRALGEPRQFAGQVLLQRLALALSTTLQRRVDILRNIADKYIWHAYKMLARSEDGPLGFDLSATARTSPNCPIS